jgi:Holliday junction resolvasome RuvABC endonuclease subunit
MIVAIDPGIDATGVAVFQMGGWRRGESFDQLLARLDTYAVLRTKRDQEIPSRLSQLADGLGQVLTGIIATTIYVERPREAGVYHSRLHRQQTKSGINAAALEKLHFAIGALVVAAMTELCDVVLVPAPKIKKSYRAELIHRALRNKNHPIGLQARPSPDLLDAIYLGVTALADPRYQPTQAAE